MRMKVCTKQEAMQVAKVTSFNSLLGTSGAGVAIQVKQAQVTHGVYAAVGALDDPEVPKTACRSRSAARARVYACD
jgi:hypothetical protein